MDAGVPIVKPVAGISIGMMSDEKKYELLTDIIGLEDFSGDMDFKVAGTDEGVTAIQLDVKIPGLTVEQIKAIFERAKTARLQILEVIKAAMPQTRASISQYAPKIELVKIPVDKIGEVIGPGGKVIKNIIATTGAQVDVEDDGTVAISGTEEEAVKKAVEWIKGLVREVQPGETFEGEVKRILPFGAFVEVLPGKEGMVHVSKMSTEFVKDPNDVVQIGQKVKVRVSEIDDQGRINLSMLFGEDADKAKAPRPMGAPVAGGTYQPRTPSEHPLAMQFRRERRGTGSSSDWRSRSTTSRPARPSSFSKDRKPRY
jgi:polyribonucleotide nucleotidyltransferase